MSEYNKFLDHVYSEELPHIDTDEVAEVARFLAEEGYGKWADEIERQLDEQQAWQSAQTVTLADGAQVLVKKACEHPSCNHFRCEREIRLGGIAI